MAPLSQTKEWSEEKNILGFIATVLLVGICEKGMSVPSARSIIPPVLGFEIGGAGRVIRVRLWPFMLAGMNCGASFSDGARFLDETFLIDPR